MYAVTRLWVVQDDRLGPHASGGGADPVDFRNRYFGAALDDASGVVDELGNFQSLPFRRFDRQLFCRVKGQRPKRHFADVEKTLHRAQGLVSFATRLEVGANHLIAEAIRQGVGENPRQALEGATAQKLFEALRTDERQRQVDGRNLQAAAPK